MDRLRQQYADITAGDLRICCFTRMNLSTKEIASLMNVSVRAIELRRYRLRKRLALDGGYESCRFPDELLKNIFRESHQNARRVGYTSSHVHGYRRGRKLQDRIEVKILPRK